MVLKMTYPIQFRKKVMKLHEGGMSYKQLSVRFGVSVRALYRWKKEIEPKNKRNKPWQKIDQKILIDDIKKYPDLYLHERADKMGVSKSGIHEAIQRLGVTYKKNTRSSQSGYRKKIYVLPNA
jgi:transposase